MPIEIEAPDGSIVEFPDGTSDDVMAKAMRETFGMKPQRGFIVPLMTDEKGETGLAVPGFIHEPWTAFKRLLMEDPYEPGTEDVKGVQDAFAAGGLAAPGTMFFPRPGSVGARAVRTIRGDRPETPPPVGRLPTPIDAAGDLGVSIPRGAASPSEFTKGLSDIAKEVPTVLPNPLRRSAERALEQIRAQEESIIGRARGRYTADDAATAPAADLMEGLTQAAEMAEGASRVVAGDTTPRPQQAAPAAPVGQQGPFRVITPDQSMEITAQPKLVELSDLKLAGGRFQPRDRSRAEYLQEVRERATRLDPEQLRPNRVSDAGPPIILDDGTIISGNGRAMSIAEVYRDPQLRAQADAYRASLGPDAANMRQPVLVMRAEGLGGDEAARFADLSNRSRIAQMSATERASRDAAALGPEGMALYQGGDFTAGHNRDFLRAFMDRAVTAAERPSVSSGGQLTQEGITRMRNAVLAAAYEDASVIARMVESADDNIRNITGALTDAAPMVAGLKADIRAGVVKPDMDPTANLLEAVQLIGDLRNRGVSPADYFAQLDAFSNLDPRTAAWVRSFYNDDLTRPISRQKMVQLLRAYVDEAAKHGEGGMFPDPTTQGDVLNVAARAARGEADEGIGAVSEGVGEGLRESRPPDRGPQDDRGLGDAVRDGIEPAGRQPEAARVIDAAESERLASERLVEESLQQYADILGMPEGRVTVDALFDRISELSTQRGGADRVTTVRLAINIAAPRLWEDHVIPAVLSRLGRNADGAWDLQTFAASYRKMHDNARKALFQSSRRRNLKSDLDKLVAVSERIPSLEHLSKGEIETFLSKLPVIGSMAKWGLSDWVGQVFLHGGFSALSGKMVAVPVAGWVLAKVLSRPVTSRSLTGYLDTLFRLLEGPNRRNEAAFKLAAHRLASDIARELWDHEGASEDAKELARRLAGEVDPPEQPRSVPPGMMRLGGPATDEQEEPGVLERAADVAGSGLAVLDLYSGGILSALAGLNPFSSFREVMAARERALEGVPRDIKAAATEPFNPVMAVFAGPKIAQKLWDQGVKGPKRAIELAEALEKKGVSREQIYKQTSKLLKDTPYAGVSKDASGKWRFEISDEGLEIEPGTGFGKISHPELQKGLEDDFRDVRSVIHTGAPAGGRFSSFDFMEDERGNLVPIRSLEARGRDIDETRRVVTHELDHLVQSEEGFSRGGNPTDIMPRDVGQREVSPSSSLGRRKAIGPRDPRHLPELRRYAGEVITLGPGDLPPVEQYARGLARMSEEQRAALPTVEEYQGLLDKLRTSELPHIRHNVYQKILAATRGPEYEQAFNAYERLGGEASAREAAERLSMTAAERRATPPELFADRPEGGRVAGRGVNHPGVDPQMMPDAETIARMPETRALAEKVFAKLSAKAKGKSDAELWELAYSSAIADMQRRIEQKGLTKRGKRIDQKIGDKGKDEVSRIIRERNKRDEREGRFRVQYDVRNL